MFFGLRCQCFLIAFRNQSIGADTGMYIRSFIRIDETSWSTVFEKETMEKGYIVFVKLIGFFTNNPLVYQCICAVIYLLSISFFLNELEDNQFFVLFLFGTLGMYKFMFTGVRQCLAISICLLSYRFIKNRRLIPFILIVYLATCFHKSAIIFIAAYLLYPLSLSLGSVFVYIPITVVASYYLEELQYWFNHQLDYAYEIEGEAGGFVFSVIVILMTIFTLFIVLGNNKVTKYSQGLINIGFIAALFWVLRISTRTAERPSFYFLIFTFASFAHAISSLKTTKERVLVKMMVIILSLAVFLYRLLNQMDFWPYSFYSN